MAKRKSPIRSRSARTDKPRSKVTSKRRAQPTPTRASRALASYTWAHLSPAKRKGKTKADFIARSIASRESWKSRKTPIRLKVKIAKEKLKLANARRAGKTMARAERARAKLHEDFREHQASVKYTRKHGASTGHSGTLQGSVLAPRGTPASELRQALIDHIKGKTPKFATSAVEWRRRRS